MQKLMLLPYAIHYDLSKARLSSFLGASRYHKVEVSSVFGSLIIQKICQPVSLVPSSFLLKARFIAYLTHIPSFLAFHLSDHPEPQSFVYLHIRFIPTRLQVAFPPFPIRSIRHALEEHLPDPLSLFVRPYGDDVAEIVTLGIIPDLRLEAGLVPLPNVVSLS